MISKRRF